MGSIPFFLLLEEAIEGKIKTAGPAKMTGVELIVLSVLALDREVNNGGYKQFFSNSSRRFAPMIVNHLFIIGCTAIADITQEALDSLDLPKLSVSAIEAALKTESEKRDRMLNRCDLAFYEKPSPFGQLFSYVKTHQDGIQI